MPSIRIITNAVSEGVNELTTCLRAQGVSVIRVRDAAGKICTRPRVLTIKWGCFGLQTRVPTGTVVLNALAGDTTLNKLHCFRTLRDAGVPVPDFTSGMAEAEAWRLADERIYERHSLRGSGGEGIRVVRINTPQAQLTQAPLYVKGMRGKRREYRIHVFNYEGVQRLFIQQKLRRQGFEDNASYNNEVRNLDAGWIFAHNDIQPPRTVTVDAAVAAIAALGINFGGVDVIEMDKLAGGSVVLEVNSAPGLQGSTAGFYAQALEAVLQIQAGVFA